MAREHAHAEKGSLKKHGDAIEDADRHAMAGKGADPVPMPEDGAHERSHAAHLGHVTGAQEHTKRAGDLRQGASPGELREPPMVQQRIGKQHR